MTSCYVSPIPSRIVMRMSRKRGFKIPVRTHFYPGPNGEEYACLPSKCRECHRERQCEEHHGN